MLSNNRKEHSREDKVWLQLEYNNHMVHMPVGKQALEEEEQELVKLELATLLVDSMKEHMKGHNYLVTLQMGERNKKPFDIVLDKKTVVVVVLH